MKEKVLLICLIALSVTLISCNNDKKYSNLIIGKYYSILYIDDIELDDVIPISMTIKSYEEFLTNNTTINQGSLKLSIYNEFGRNIIVEYQVGPHEAKWNIKNGNLYYNYSSPDFKLKFLSSTAKNYYEREIVTHLRDFIENDLVYIMEQYTIEEGHLPNKIIELNETRLITEDSYGEQTIQQRIK